MAPKEKIENVCAAILMIKVTQAAVPHTNKCLEAHDHHFEHLL